MPSRPTGGRVLLFPGGDFDQRAIPLTRERSRVWFRVHRADAPSIVFGRWLHHRFSHPDCPFPLLYVGATVQTCLWEVFGDDVFQNKRTIAEGRWCGSCLSQITVPEVPVCALTLERTRAAMTVDRASLMSADLTVPQAWGLAVQRHPGGFCGIKYSSRFVDRPCLALFDRNMIGTELKASVLGRLNELDETMNWLEERKASLV